MKIRQKIVIIVAVAAFVAVGINLTKFKSDSVYSVDISLLLEPDTNCSRSTPRSDMEDLICMKPPNVLKNYKNPCWYSAEQSDRLLCLPYFQVIGTDKSASTDLFDRICRHPQVLPNSGSLEKETMWWSWTRYGHWLKHNVDKKQFSDYLQLFDKASKIINSTRDADGQHLLITGDGTPMDFWDFSGWPQIPQNAGLKEPIILTPHLIRHINPNVKLIVIFRNPVDRLYSDYFFLGLGTQTVEGFVKSVDESLAILANCMLESSLRSCLFSRNLHVSMTARIHLGFYSVYLKEWLNVFPRNQMIVFETEDYSRNIANHLGLIFNFLDIDPLSDGDIEKIAIRAHKYQTATKQKMPQMPDRTRRKLEALYTDYNEELAQLLADDRFLWHT